MPELRGGRPGLLAGEVGEVTGRHPAARGVEDEGQRSHDAVHAPIAPRSLANRETEVTSRALRLPGSTG
jgi:hypothetical protein